jgi:diphthamide biosynthesis protein 2
MSLESAHLTAPPVLSTPESHIFEDPTPPAINNTEVLSSAQLCERYEIDRTATEIRDGKWTRVGLQFPDSMLPHAVKVYEELQRLLEILVSTELDSTEIGADTTKMLEMEMGNLTVQPKETVPEKIRLFILADTSYGACCVDEIAAEHVDAQVVVHYGRSCLSPTARLPVIYVFTIRPLDLSHALSVFKQTYPDPLSKIILMSDLPYSSHLSAIHTTLSEDGYTSLFLTETIHEPTSPIPNRTVPESLKDYSLFHIGTPPASLLLTLSTRLPTTHIYLPTSAGPLAPLSTLPLLRRRYALTLSLASARIIGILVATLSVANYADAISRLQKQIATAGKKSYTVIVGKVNAAKVANFAEVDGWVVVGCWESSLVEGSEFYRPVVTPFELEVALKGEARVWGLEWWGGFEKVITKEEDVEQKVKIAVENENENGGESDDEDEPPEFDLRTGRYISRTRPMGRNTERNRKQNETGEEKATPTAVIKRANGDLIQIGGVPSPGAEFLRENRTWQGLGTDFETDFTNTGAVMEEGRSGVARGYTVGDQDKKT